MIKVTAVFEYCIRREVHNDLAVVIRQLTVLRTHTDPYHPFSLFTKWQCLIWKTKDRLGVFVLCWRSSNWTRFKRRGSSSIQKYSTAIFLSQQTFIPVRQWPSHISSHSDKKTKTKHNLLHRAKIKAGTDHISVLQVLDHWRHSGPFFSVTYENKTIETCESCIIHHNVSHIENVLKGTDNWL